VKIIEGVPSTGVVHERGHVTGVRTSLGDIKTDIVVNCAGMWARQFGAARGRDDRQSSGRALLSDHRADQESSPNMPVLEDPGAYGYYREEAVA